MGSENKINFAVGLRRGGDLQRKDQVGFGDVMEGERVRRD